MRSRWPWTPRMWWQWKPRGRWQCVPISRWHWMSRNTLGRWHSVAFLSDIRCARPEPYYVRRRCITVIPRVSCGGLPGTAWSARARVRLHERISIPGVYGRREVTGARVKWHEMVGIPGVRGHGEVTGWWIGTHRRARRYGRRCRWRRRRRHIMKRQSMPRQIVTTVRKPRGTSRQRAAPVDTGRGWLPRIYQWLRGRYTRRDERRCPVTRRSCRPDSCVSIEATAGGPLVVAGCCSFGMFGRVV